MNEMLLLEAIGEIHDGFILSAQQKLIPSIIEEEPPKVRALPKRRALLLAAAVALFLFLMGCAVVLFGLQDMNLGRFSFDGGFGRTYTAEFISMQGLKGSPNYEAALEYQLFMDSYDADREILRHLGEEPRYAGYEAYVCYTPEIKAKIDEICETYDLNLLGQFLQTRYTYKMYEALGMQDVVQGAVYHGGYVYPSGTFQVSGRFALPWDNPARWNYDVEFTYRNVMKTDFDTTSFSVRDMSAVEQWHYTTGSGEDVLLVMNGDRVCILADRETYFATVLLDAFAVTGEGEKLYMDKAALEAVADSFCFTYSIHPLDRTILTNRDLYGYAEPTPQMDGADPYANYDAYINDFLETSAHPEFVWYARRDIDGNGTEELMIAMEDNAIQEVFTMADGNMWLAFGAGNLHVCENGVVERLEYIGQMEQHSYYRLKGAEVEFIGVAMYSPHSDTPYAWSETGGAAKWNWTVIDKAEYEEILDSHPRVDVGLRRITEYWNEYG